MLKTKTLKKEDTLEKILTEVKSLRREVSIFMPQENLEGYAHPRRLKRSYEKAIRVLPPRA